MEGGRDTVGGRRFPIPLEEKEDEESVIFRPRICVILPQMFETCISFDFVFYIYIFHGGYLNEQHGKLRRHSHAGLCFGAAMTCIGNNRERWCEENAEVQGKGRSHLIHLI